MYGGGRSPRSGWSLDWDGRAGRRGRLRFTGIAGKMVIFAVAGGRRLLAEIIWVELKHHV